MHIFCPKSPEIILYVSANQFGCMDIINKCWTSTVLDINVYYYPRNGNTPPGLQPCGILHSSGSRNLDIQHSSICLICASSIRPIQVGERGREEGRENPVIEANVNVHHVMDRVE